MNKRIAMLLSVALACVSCVTSLRADTTFFENGFFFISTPTEFDDVVVGEGAIVTFLDGVVINGDLEVVDGGFVSANNCLIEGDVKTDRAAFVDIQEVTIGGDVQIKRTGGEPVLGFLPAIFISRSDIYGNVKIINNNVNAINVADNRIGGNLQVRNNRTNSTLVSNNQTNLNRHCRR